MNEFTTALLASLPVFAVAGAGMAMRLLNWLTAEADASLLRVLINVLIPCLILHSVVGNPALEETKNLILPPVLGFATILAGLGVAYLCRRLAGLEEGKSRRTFSFMVAIYNYGYVPLPLALALFDRETVGVLFVFMTGVEAAMWTVGLSVLRGDRGRAQWRKVINPPFVAIVTGVALNLGGAVELLPEVLRPVSQVLSSAVGMLGQCAIPVGLLLIGATIADHRQSISLARDSKATIWACVLRLGVLPILFLLAPRYLPMSDELKRIVVLEAAMPSAVFPIVMARHYGGDTGMALRIVVATSALGLLTIPCWIRFGMAWVGL